MTKKQKLIAFHWSRQGGLVNMKRHRRYLVSCLRTSAVLCCLGDNQNTREVLLVYLELATHYAIQGNFAADHQARGRHIVGQICAIYLLTEDVHGRCTERQGLWGRKQKNEAGGCEMRN